MIKYRERGATVAGGGGIIIIRLVAAVAVSM